MERVCDKDRTKKTKRSNRFDSVDNARYLTVFKDDFKVDESAGQSKYKIFLGKLELSQNQIQLK